MDPCKNCCGTGIVYTSHESVSDNSLLPCVKKGTHVGIVGGGIGGLALALACQHRKIPYTVYERDETFDERSQGYGLTMQQGGKALQALGLETTGKDRLLGKGIHSKRHRVHLPDGTQVGEWGMKVWGRPDTKKEDAKRKREREEKNKERRRDREKG
jgi:2-polyprenyl-6-methoxyphenol hydroxylase-like FAD-dependent oxidoreductase